MVPHSDPPVQRFATTRWSLVVAAGRRDEPGPSAALAELCRAYWYPVYAFIRRRGHGASDAEDLTQAFFARLLERRTFDLACPTRGRFRTFLLTACQNFLGNERDRSLAARRGGGSVRPLTVDADGRYREEPAHDETPERLFERRWALALLERVLARLRAEYEEGGRGAAFDALKELLTGKGAPHAELAVRLGSTEGAVKVAAHRLRKRYAALLREEIGETVADPAEVEDEVRALFEALG